MHGYLKIRTFFEFRNLYTLNLQIINNEYGKYGKY